MPPSHVTTSHGTKRKPAMAMVPPAKPASPPGMIAAAAAQPAKRPAIDASQMQLMIAEAAYYCAERRGFTPGGELQDWLDAEAQLRAMLGE